VGYTAMFWPSGERAVSVTCSFTACWEQVQGFAAVGAAGGSSAITVLTIFVVPNLVPDVGLSPCAWQGCQFQLALDCLD